MPKPTPTHIGEEEPEMPLENDLDQKALAPAKQELARRLNQADPPIAAEECIDRKLARISGRSVPLTSSEGTKSNVTEALRAMATGHGTSGAINNKSVPFAGRWALSDAYVQIRCPSRPSGRLRGSGTFSPAPFNTSPSKSPVHQLGAARSPPVSPQKMPLDMDVEESNRRGPWSEVQDWRRSLDVRREDPLTSCDTPFAKATTYTSL